MGVGGGVTGSGLSMDEGWGMDGVWSLGESWAWEGIELGWRLRHEWGLVHVGHV